MTIITRAGKGTPLTEAEMDTNFTDLRDNPDGILVPKTKGEGIKIDPTAPDFGWHDIVGALHVDQDDANRAQFVVYHDGIKARQFIEGTSEAFIDFHMPHDYVPNSSIFVHAHWSHDSATCTGGSCTWGFELMYAKGHDQADFPETVTVSVAQSLTVNNQHRHMIAEGLASTPGGSAVLLDQDLLEADGIIQCRIFLDSNDLTDSVTVPDPFVHFVDIHYQSTGLPTKNRAPDFWT
jgi:hypothetical protein